jgi:hypothetical protein
MSKKSKKVGHDEDDWELNETDDFHKKDIAARMGNADEKHDEDTVVECETTLPDQILDGEGIDIEDPEAEGGTRHELALPVGHKCTMSLKAFNRYRERGIGLKVINDPSDNPRPDNTLPPA